MLAARLKVSDWLAGGRYSIADIAAFIWVLDAPLIGRILLSGTPGWTSAVMRKRTIDLCHVLHIAAKPSDISDSVLLVVCS